MNSYSAFSLGFVSRIAKPFLADETGAIFTYADVERETARYSNFLMGLGMRRGDRVAVQIEKSPQAIFIYLACLRAGLCYLPLNSAYQQSEISYFLNDAQPGVAICSPADEPLFMRDRKSVV